MFLDNPEVMGRCGRIHWKDVQRRAGEILGSLQSDIDVTRKVAMLSVREQQVLEIAKAISARSQVLIMDEPSAALPENEVQTLFETVRLLRERGVAIIYVSHRMKEIEELCDRVTILRDGRVVEVREMRETTIRHIVDGMIGRSLENYYPYEPRQVGDRVLELKGLCAGGIRQVSLTLRRGEILGIYGLAGSGTTELAECVFGLGRPQSGDMWLEGKPYRPRVPRDAIRRGIGYVPADRKRQGIVAPLSIEKNMILPIAKRLGRLGYIRSAGSREVADRFYGGLNIRATGIGQLVGSLSGGNQQKVVLGKWLATGPKVLLLNEPTRGVDIGAKSEIYALMNDLAKEGIAIVMISSELPEIIGMSDRVAVMNRGRLTGEFSRSELSEEQLLAAASEKRGGNGDA